MIDLALSKIDSLLRFLGNNKAGAATTEMALVLPLLTSMVFGTFEMGSVVYSYSAMQFGANVATRTIAVNRMTNAQAEAAVRDSVPVWMREDVSVTVTQSHPTDSNANIVRVQLSVDAEQATPMALLTRLAPWRLTANVVMKQEIPYVD